MNVYVWNAESGEYGLEEWSEDMPIVRTYRALSNAAGRIGAADYLEQCRKHRGPKKSFQYNPCQALRDICAALPLVLSGEMSTNDAMCLIHDYDAMRLRMMVPATSVEGR